MAENTYNVAYSTNARAKCKYSGCGETIAKDELRFTKSSASAFSDKKPKCEFYHAKCMFLAFVRARKTTKKIENVSDIEGYDSINQADKDQIKKYIKEFQSGGMKDQVPKISRKRKADDDDDEGHKKKRVNPDNKKKTKKTDDVEEMAKSKKNIKQVLGDSDDDFPLKSKMPASKAKQIVKIDDSDEDDEPTLKITLKDDKKTKSKSKPKDSDDEDEDYEPVKMKISKSKAKDSDDDEDEDDKPVKMKISKSKSKAKDSDDEDDEPFKMKASTFISKSKAKDSDDESDEVLVKKIISKSKSKAKDSDDEDESEEDEPVKKSNLKSKSKAKDSEDEDESEEDEPKAKKSRQVKPKEDSDNEDEDDEVKESNSDNENGILSGKVFALCGKLSMPTEKIAALIEKNGGKYSKTITKAVTHVIAAKPEDDKTKKLQKAKEDGKIIVTESFLKKGH